MDKSFHPQSSDARRSGDFFTNLRKVFDRALRWLVGFFQLTEEEQKEAGIYLERPYYEE
jgi:hypothetical protein